MENVKVMADSCPNIKSGIYTEEREKNITQTHAKKIEPNVSLVLYAMNPKGKKAEYPIR